VCARVGGLFATYALVAPPANCGSRGGTDSCEFWQHNVRPIALRLVALRAVDRYDVTKRG